MAKRKGDQQRKQPKKKKKKNIAAPESVSGLIAGYGNADSGKKRK